MEKSTLLTTGQAPDETVVDPNNTLQPTEKPLSGFGKLWNWFMIFALTLGIFYLVSIVIAVPQYRVAGILFIVMSIGMLVKRVLSLKTPHSSEPNVQAPRESL